MTLNQVIQMYIDSNNVMHIQNLINAAILMYRKYGVMRLARFCQAVILPEYGMLCCSDLITMIVALDPAVHSLNYEGAE